MNDLILLLVILLSLGLLILFIVFTAWYFVIVPTNKEIKAMRKLFIGYFKLPFKLIFGVGLSKESKESSNKPPKPASAVENDKEVKI